MVLQVTTEGRLRMYKFVGEANEVLLLDILSFGGLPSWRCSGTVGFMGMGL